MDESQFVDMQKNAPEIQLQSTMVKFKVFEEDLPVICEADRCNPTSPDNYNCNNYNN